MLTDVVAILQKIVFKMPQSQISYFSCHFYEMNLIWILIQIHLTNFYEKKNYLYFMTQALKDNDLFRVSRGGSKK